jgi:hypothetical protein
MLHNSQAVHFLAFKYPLPTYLDLQYCFVLPPSQIISHFKNLGESKFFKFDQIYIAK